MPDTDSVPRNLWRRGRIALDGFRLAYDVAGTGRVVVFLGGGPGNGPGYLTPLADSVTTPGWRLVLFHQRGTGRSPVPPGTSLSVSQATDDLALLARHLEVDQMLLVGHGYGAGLALVTAARHPDLVAGAVLISPGPFDDRPTSGTDGDTAEPPDEVEPALRAAGERWEAAAADGNWTAVQEATLDTMRLLAPRYVCDPVVRDRWQRELAENFDHDPCTHAALRRSLAEVDLPATARAVRCPVRVVRGARDFQPADTVEALRTELPCVEVTVVPDAGHLTWLDRPDQVAASVRAAMRA